MDLVRVRGTGPLSWIVPRAVLEWRRFPIPYPGQIWHLSEELVGKKVEWWPEWVPVSKGGMKMADSSERGFTTLKTAMAGKNSTIWMIYEKNTISAARKKVAESSNKCEHLSEG